MLPLSCLTTRFGYAQVRPSAPPSTLDIEAKEQQLKALLELQEEQLQKVEKAALQFKIKVG